MVGGGGGGWGRGWLYLVFERGRRLITGVRPMDYVARGKSSPQRPGGEEKDQLAHRLLAQMGTDMR